MSPHADALRSSTYLSPRANVRLPVNPIRLFSLSPAEFSDATIPTRRYVVVLYRGVRPSFSRSISCVVPSRFDRSEGGFSRSTESDNNAGDLARRRGTHRHNLAELHALVFVGVSKRELQNPDRGFDSRRRLSVMCRDIGDDVSGHRRHQ